jgi:hypothetical protein
MNGRSDPNLIDVLNAANDYGHGKESLTAQIRSKELSLAQVDISQEIEAY